MTSQNSTNNISLLSLMKDDLKHKRWMLALSILFNCLAGPVIFLFYISNTHNNSIFQVLPSDLAVECMQYLGEIQLVTMAVVAYIGALITGLGGFRYLYSRRMVDLYHSAPVSRKQLFAVSWLNGFLIWFIPFLAANLFVLIAAPIYTRSSAYIGSISALILKEMFLITVCYLIMYNVCIMAVMFSGNVTSAIINALICGLAFAAAFGCYLACMEYFRMNFYLPDNAILQNPCFIFAPFVSPILMVLLFADELTFSGLYVFLIGSILVMLACGVAAFFLYCKRPSELSEKGVDNKWVRIVLRGVTSFLAGIAFGMFFCIFSVYAGARWIWILFGIFFGSALWFCILNIIYHTSFKEIFSHKLQYVVVLAACIVTFLGAAYDVLGYDHHLPSKNAITGISFELNMLTGNTRFELGEDGKVHHVGVKRDRFEKTRFTNKDAIYALLSALTSSDESGFDGSTIWVKVYTKTGSYYRRYNLPWDKIDLIKPFVETDEYLRAFYPIESLELGMPHQLCINSLENSEIVLTDAGRIAQLMNAYHQDFLDYSKVENLLKSNYQFYIDLGYINNNDDYTRMDLEVQLWYQRTINLLKEWYPECTWSSADIPFDNLTVNLDLYGDKNDSSEDLLYSYFGYDADRNAMTPSIFKDDYRCYAYDLGYFWRQEITDSALLKKIEPYITLGNYRNTLMDDYVYLGEVSWGQARTISCYAQYGKIPTEFIAEINKRQADINRYYDEYGDSLYYDTIEYPVY